MVVKAEITPTSVLLDGVDVARGTQSLTLTAGALEPARLTLNMILTTGARFQGDVIVELSAANVDILRHLGWTPPVGAS